ncbi:hypothetical protein L916_07558 [Phytophthora nicotianae]|nr:hypothetical protein L916_07558 [Phytophthora nicotianae]ETO76994.1 hypothetical protein F444_07852 [Phytophthora nicotianae P1976]
METCERRLPGGKKMVVPCPSMMRDYQRWMGGVDIHDQLRLQRYSVQLSVVFRKYYKTIFLGLVDMAIANAFIIFREARKVNIGEGSADHAKFMRMPQAQMLELKDSDFADVAMSPAPPTPSTQPRPISSEHTLTVSPNWDSVKIRRDKKERCASRFYCEACSDGESRIYLCDRVRPKHYPGNNLTCFQIWHSKWKNGSERPRPLVGRDIQMRGLGKKRRRPSSGDEDEEADEEDGSE